MRLLATFSISLIMIGAAAWVLADLESIQRLGAPGVRVVAEEVYDADGKVVGTNSVYLPERVLGYASKKMPIAQVVLDWLPDDTVLGGRLYEAPDGFSVLVNAVLMGRDRTSLHKPQYCLTGVGWHIDASESMETSVPVEQPHRYELPVMKLIASREVNSPGGGTRTLRGVYVYWFVADGQLTADHNQRMFWMARDLVRRGVLQRWAYISCFTVCDPGQEEATFERMAGLIGAMVPQFQLAVGER